MSLLSPGNVLYLSILAGVFTIVLKTTAFWLTDSVSLLSDAAESVVNLTAAIIAFIAIRLSARPADQSHTYGHEKIEFFSSGFEGALILIAAISMGAIGIQRLFIPHELHTLDKGMLLSLAGTLINGVVAVILLQTGKKHNSIILEADGKHLLTDVWTTMGVLFGLFLVKVTGFYMLDALLAIAVALLILNTGAGLVWRSFKGLMDHALPEQELESIRAIIRANIQEKTQFHALRSRQAGGRKFIDFHLLLPGSMSLKEAHTIMEKIEEDLRVNIRDIEVQIHAEPLEDPRSYTDYSLKNP